MTATELERKLNDLERHLDSASPVDRRRIAPRLQTLLARSHAPAAATPAAPRRSPREDEVDLFDNMPV